MFLMMFREKFPTFNKWCQTPRAGAPEFYKPHVLVNNANGGQIELIICDVNDFFTFISWNAIKIFDAGVESMEGYQGHNSACVIKYSTLIIQFKIFVV